MLLWSGFLSLLPEFGRKCCYDVEHFATTGATKHCRGYSAGHITNVIKGRRCLREVQLVGVEHFLSRVESLFLMVPASSRISLLLYCHCCLMELVYTCSQQLWLQVTGRHSEATTFVIGMLDPRFLEMSLCRNS